MNDRGLIAIRCVSKSPVAAPLTMNDNRDCFEIAGIVFHSENNVVEVMGKPVSVTKMQFRLLHFLASHAGTAYTRRQIIDAVQGADYPATERSVDSQIGEVRRKFGEHGRLIEAVRGVGYRFTESGF
jgi:two-component system, OmpR family, alkaline phosphatase synthesis response regulator PhoP